MQFVCVGHLFSELFLPFFDLHWDSRLLLCEISKNHGDNFLFPIQQYPCHLHHFLISQYFKDAQQVHIPYPIHYHFSMSLFFMSPSILTDTQLVIGSFPQAPH